MDWIREWAIAFCGACICGGIAHLLAPAGKMEKTYRMCVNLFVLFVLIFPFLNQSISFSDFSLDTVQNFSLETDSLEKESRQQILSTLETNLETILYQQLSESFPEIEKISVTVNSDVDNSISFKEIRVYLNRSTSQQDEIDRCVYELTAAHCTIYESEEEEKNERKEMVFTDG